MGGPSASVCFGRKTLGSASASVLEADGSRRKNLVLRPPSSADGRPRPTMSVAYSMLHTIAYSIRSLSGNFKDYANKICTRKLTEYDLTIKIPLVFW